MGRKIDLTGRKFGRLTVIEYAGKKQNGKSAWLCECSCGNKKIITQSDLNSGRTNSCGCLRDELNGSWNFKDLTGKTFFDWTVIKRGKGNNSKKTTWLCRCKCGEISEVTANNLLGGKSKRCRKCANKLSSKRGTKHGMSRERIYNIYEGMKNRCQNKGNYSYSKYGGRGISVCQEWLGENGFQNFYEWSMENGYSDELSIDRIDVNGNYEPSNCRWATQEEQVGNRRVTRKIIYKGVEKTLSDWSKETGINYHTLHSRIFKQNWDVKKAIETPV